MANLWTLGGLSPAELVRRTVRESWQDDVFGQGGRMAFYHFLAIFPSLLVFLAIGARVPFLGEQVRTAVGDLSRHVLPDQVAQLFQQMTQELSKRRPSGLQLLSIGAGTLWATLNGTWAMIYGLNRAYEVEERRSWWELAITIVGLTVSLALTGGAALLLQTRVAGLEWVVLAIALSLSFALLYRFAPSVRDHEWRWSTPGAVCALVLWIGATFGARLYFDRVDNYARSYGHLNGVVMLLLWLYVTNGAILIGGEMNSEIEKAAGRAGQAKPPAPPA